MQKIGILGCGAECEDVIDKIFTPWFELKKNYNLIFSAASTQFKEYFDNKVLFNNSATIKKLEEYKEKKLIENIIEDNSDLEHKVRDKSLQFLLNQNVDLVWLLDFCDEYYSINDIINIINWINRKDNSFITWFSIPFKNYIFDEKSWIDGFCPPRIFRINSYPYKLNKMIWDNDCEYRSVNQGSISYKALSNKSIPKNLLNNGIKHLTWLNNEKSKKKIDYQLKHFQNNCSYKWNEEKKCVEFNKEYFLKFGLPLPIINHD